MVLNGSYKLTLLEKMRKFNLRITIETNLHLPPECWDERCAWPWLTQNNPILINFQCYLNSFFTLFRHSQHLLGNITLEDLVVKNMKISSTCSTEPFSDSSTSEISIFSVLTSETSSFPVSPELLSVRLFFRTHSLSAYHAWTLHFLSMDFHLFSNLKHFIFSIHEILTISTQPLAVKNMLVS